MNVDAEKIRTLAQSEDVSSVLLAFELNESLSLVEEMLEIDARIRRFANKTFLIKTNEGKIYIKDDTKAAVAIELDDADADVMRLKLLDFNPKFSNFQFVETFVSSRYGINIVFSF